MRDKTISSKTVYQTKANFWTFAMKYASPESGVPILSAGAVAFLLNQLIQSDLQDARFYATLVSLTILFLCSIGAFVFLKERESNKDKYLISSVGNMVSDVSNLGRVLAENNQGLGPNVAKELNTIFQTVQNHSRSVLELSKKEYTGIQR